MIYFLDTNICIYLLKNKFPALRDHLAAHKPEAIKIPAMVLAELWLGALKSEHPQKTRKHMAALLEPLEVVPFDRQAASAYAEVRATLEKQGTPIGPNDLVIAATVLGRNGTLVTHNRKEFGRVPGLRVVDWTTET